MSGGGWGGWGGRGVLSGLTAAQYEHLKATQPAFVAEPSRIEKYDDPVLNVADRNWQEKLRKDSTYTWTAADRESYAKNSDYGPHNAGPELDKAVFKKK